MRKLLLPALLLLIWIMAIMWTPVHKKVSAETFTLSDSSKTLKGNPYFPIGASVNIRLLASDTLYKKTIIHEFNSITAENAMKWEAIHPSENRYDFVGSDAFVKFGITHHMRIHGHNLCWYQANPSWVINYSADMNGWNNILENHIKTVVGRYKGIVNSWDVVNEAIDEKGQFRKNNIWYSNLGNKYIERAFKYAHDADPEALLFYNDYGQDESEIKCNSILNLIKTLQQNNIPIHGIGLQMHININSSNKKIEDVISKFAKTGLLIHISELDISINGEKGNEKKMTPELSNLQAEKYQFIVDSYKRLVPRKQQFGITTWDVGDKDSWIPKQNHRPDWPLLFDSNYKKKAAYYSFLHSLR